MGEDKKKGSERYDRISVKFAEEVCIDRREDYMQFVPYDLPEQFTAKDFAKARQNPGAACADRSSDLNRP